MKEKLRIEDLSKTYGGIYALEKATLTFERGEIHALLGENGAGKSTLCKLLSGAITPDSGIITVDGTVHRGFTPVSAKENGISMIYQEFSLVQQMTVYENMFLGKELCKGLHVDKTEMIKRTERIFEHLKVHIDPQVMISTLSAAYCQLIEIGKAILENAKVLIMDEPTSSLTIQETEDLFELLNELKQKGITIIYISHRIEELLVLTDRITIMRDGRIIGTYNTKEVERKELIKNMVGRELGGEYPEIENDGKQGEEVLRIQNLVTDKLKGISFSLYSGEILGLAGLVGAGRSEVVRALFGADPIKEGHIWVNGKEIQINSPGDAISNGISMIPEDRKREGIHLHLPIGLNISLVRIKELSKFFTVNTKKEEDLINRFINVLSIKLSSPKMDVASLSGGNQQKIVISKWLSTESDIIFFDEPTRGIDITTKKEIYDLMDYLRKQGKSIIMISSEMVEIIGMCNRIIVMHEGKIASEIPHTEITQERILQAASDGYNIVDQISVVG